MDYSSIISSITDIITFRQDKQFKADFQHEKPKILNINQTSADNRIITVPTSAIFDLLLLTIFNSFSLFKTLPVFKEEPEVRLNSTSISSIERYLLTTFF